MLKTDLRRGSIRALGAMSGTSLDGVDVAAVDTDGHEITGFGPSDYHAFDAGEQASLRAALGLWPDARQGGTDDALTKAEEVLHRAHLLALQPIEADLVGFHGQTLAHDPGGRGTHQLGDGQRLADGLGRPVVWDFRSADVALGGQGAPLAPFYHFACARLIGATAPLAFLNLGGVGNITWVDPRCTAPEDPGALLAFDTGPVNAPINDLMAARRGVGFDRDGALARQGTVAEGALELFLRETYFHRMPPKSLDRDDFAVMLDLVRELSDADAAATMCAMAASAVMQGMDHLPAPPGQVLVCGGGRHNPVIMQMLSAALECDVKPVECVGLDGDMLEAQAFGYLAVRVARGLPTSCPTTTGVQACVGGGTLSIPGCGGASRRG